MRREVIPAASVALIVLGVGLLRINTVWQQPLQLPQAGAIVTVDKGEALSDVLRRAEARQWLTHANWVGNVARIFGLDQQIKAGEFEVNSPMTAAGLIQQLAEGEVLQYAVTLPEGITLAEAVALLQRDPKLKRTPQNRLTAELLAMGNGRDSAEGLFLPETWSYTRADSELDVLRRSHFAMMNLLNVLWEERPADLPLPSAYAALILASIVEKETGVTRERAQIAGVFLRRLAQGMRLQTDPTVIYGLGDEYDGDLKRRHLRDTANPYNTYAISGLPPTPIALPGEAALRAVFSPDASDALYFVAKGDGSHAFSATLAEHEDNVRRYQLSRRSDYRSSPQKVEALKD